MRMQESWGGQHAAEAEAAVAVVQKAMQLCLALACDMGVVAPSKGKEMDACDITTGVSFIKEGDSTPVTAADFAIQGFVAAELKRRFPNDRFMGEEDAGDLRENSDLCELALALCARSGGPSERDDFLAAVDSGLEPDRGQGERVWVLDPIDGTKGFMTGCGYVVGLALLVDGEPVVGAMGVPVEEESPPLMVAVKGHGLRWFGADGAAPLPYAPPAPEWAQPGYAHQPPWLLSPSKAEGACAPFGVEVPPETLCCGAMIKYFATAAGRVAGFVQYEQKLKTWDHACGVICVNESGGRAVDGRGEPVRFPGRTFEVAGGVVCSSPLATIEMEAALLASATPREE